MRKLFAVGIPVLLCCAAMAQQTDKAPHGSVPDAQTFFTTSHALDAKVSVITVNGQNCPVMASAQRGGGGAVVQTRKGSPAEPLIELKMHFSAMAHSGITEATVSLHGTDGRPRAELAYSSAPSLPEMVEVAHLSGSADHALTSASIRPAKVVNVRWIGITAIKFADGTEWQPSETSWCHIQPNGFQLVGASQ